MLKPSQALSRDRAALAAALADLGLKEDAERSRWLGEYRFCTVRDPKTNAFEIGGRLSASVVCREWSYDAIPLTSPLHMAEPAGETFWPQANLTAIHMPDAWDLPAPFGAGAPNLGRDRVYLCLIDNGCQSHSTGHAELRRAGNYGWDPVGGADVDLGVPAQPGAAAGEGAHGTACAGIAAAEWEVTPGVVGIAPYTRIFSLAMNAPGSAANVISALNAARTTALPNEDPVGTDDRDKEHRRVILLSVFHNALASTAPFVSAISDAIAADIPVVIPTGNDDAAAIPFPASEPGVIACGAVLASGLRVAARPVGRGTTNGAAEWGSNYSAVQPFIVAPGTGITTTDLGAAQGYTATNYATNFEGTSAAAAHAAGLAALLLSHNPRLLPADVRRILHATAEKVGGYTYGAADANHPDGTWHEEVGHGRIHAQLAVQEARRVRAEIQVITGIDPAACEFGDVLYRRTRAVEIRLRHIATMCTRPIIFELPPVLPLHCQWEPGTLLTQTVASGADAIVRLQYTAPSADEEITGPDIEIKSDDYLNRSVTLTVHARSIAPPIVDSVLVLDRSGSMSGSTIETGVQRWQAVTAAADLYITLLEDEHRLGIVRFDDRYRNPEDILAWMTLAGPIGSRAALRDALSSGSPLAPDGRTSISGGMILGMQVLEALAASSPAHARAMVVMTDGHHNEPPAYSSALAEISGATQGVPRVFAVGVGLDTIDSEFDAIVTVTQGYKYQTGPIVSDMVVSELFTKVLSNAVDADFAVDPQRTALPGDKQSTDVALGDTDFQADFIILFREDVRAKKMRPKIWLEAPDGTILSASDVLAGSVPNLKGAATGRHMVLRCLLPPFAAPRAHIGTWKVWVENTIEPGPSEAVTIQLQQVTLTYSVMVMVKSDLRLRGHLVHPDRKPGHPFKIVVEPTLYGLPVALSVNPEARVRRPDGVVRLVPLARDANGAYTGQMTDTGVAGVYTVDVAGSAVSPAGVELERFVQLQTMVDGGGVVDTTDTPEGGTGTAIGDGGARPGCLCAIWCGFWRFWWRLITCGRCR